MLSALCVEALSYSTTSFSRFASPYHALRAHGSSEDPKFNAAAEAGEAPEPFCDTLCGGPEVVKKHPERTLVLMWPDYLGLGTFGLESRPLEAALMEIPSTTRKNP